MNEPVSREVGSMARLGADTPTDAEDRAFWATLIVSQVWAASDLIGASRWIVVGVWLAMAFSMRWPYWRRAWLRREDA